MNKIIDLNKLNELSSDELQTCYDLIQKEIKKREKEILLESIISSLKYFHDKYRDTPETEFDPSKVTMESRKDGGYVGMYNNGNNYLKVVRHVTWRKGDYDMFTDYTGKIDGNKIYIIDS